MALTAQTAQFITQLGLLTLVDPSQGPKGPEGTVAYKLVPTNCWYNSQPFPREVQNELKATGYDTFTNEGVEYWLVPDETSTNLPGTLSHYAQTTSAADLVNPPGGGVNRAAETIDTADHTVEAKAVSKYVKSTDNWDEAHKAVVEFNDRVTRQISDPSTGVEDIPAPKYRKGKK